MNEICFRPAAIFAGWLALLGMASTLMAAPESEKPADAGAGVQDPIERLVAKLSESRGLWINGVSPIIQLPANAPIGQVISNVFAMTGFDRGNVKRFRLLESRLVKIPVGIAPETYTAALTTTDMGMKIVLLENHGQGTNWWSRVYGVEGEPPANDLLKAMPLRVTAVVSTNEVQVNQPFKMEVRVENSSNVPQTLRVMNCSWDEHWQSSHPNAVKMGHICSKNFAVDVKLEPKGAYIKELEMLVDQVPSSETFSFQMGFTGIESNRTFWSDEVLLKVKK